MIQTVKNYTFAQRSLTPNTVIGGIGAYINTVADLEAKLELPSGFVRFFEKRGNDIFFKPRSYYNLPANTFKDDVYITKYIDSEGFVNSIGGFCFSSSTIKQVIFNRTVKVASYSFSNSMLEYFEGNNLQLILSYSFDACIYLTTINAEKITNILTYGVRNTPNLSNVNFKAVEIGIGAFYSSNVILDLSKVTKIQNHSLSSGIYTKLSFDSLVRMVDNNSSPFASLSLCKTAYFPVLEEVANTTNLFSGWSAIELISMKKLKTYGSYADGGTSTQYGFISLKTGCTIEVNIALATANSGTPHAALIWVKNNRGAIVKFYDDNGNYVSTL